MSDGLTMHNNRHVLYNFSSHATYQSVIAFNILCSFAKTRTFIWCCCIMLDCTERTSALWTMNIHVDIEKKSNDQKRAYVSVWLVISDRNPAISRFFLDFLISQQSVSLRNWFFLHSNSSHIWAVDHFIADTALVSCSNGVLIKLTHSDNLFDVISSATTTKSGLGVLPELRSLLIVRGLWIEMEVRIIKTLTKIHELVLPMSIWNMNVIKLRNESDENIKKLFDKVGEYGLVFKNNFKTNDQIQDWDLGNRLPSTSSSWMRW